MALNDNKVEEFDPKKFLIWGLLASVFLMFNTIGWNSSLYGAIDSVLNPFVIVTRNFAFNTQLLITEINNKSNVLKENIELKRTIQQYEELKVENKKLTDQITKLEAQTNISAATERKFQLVKVLGVQNIFSVNPEILIYTGDNSQLKVGSTVYYEKNTLLGFVKEIQGNTARVALFYSPDVKFNIPVQNLREPSQKGFIDGIRDGYVKIRNISKDVVVGEGDTWTTTNDVAEVLPNLIVGKVKKVQNQPQNPFQELDIELPFSLSTITYVLIEESK